MDVRSKTMMTVWALFMLIAAPASCQLFGNTFSGDLTYYGTGGIGGGNCAFGGTGALNQPWASGIGFVALNSPQWNGGIPCGMCIAYRGTGGGSGGTPLPTSWQYAAVCDLCPECKPGELDLAASGDGRWAGEWYPVQCNVGGAGFFYFTTGTSHGHYTKMMIANARVPVASAKVKQGGSFVEMRRTSDNHFEFDSGISYPAEFQLTSMTGETVTDTVSSGGPGQGANGVAQFSFSSAYGSVGGGGASAPASTPAPQPKPQPAPSAPSPRAPASSPPPPSPSAPVASPPPKPATPAAPVVQSPPPSPAIASSPPPSSPSPAPLTPSPSAAAAAASPSPATTTPALNLAAAAPRAASPAPTPTPAPTVTTTTRESATSLGSRLTAAMRDGSLANAAGTTSTTTPATTTSAATTTTTTASTVVGSTRIAQHMEQAIGRRAIPTSSQAADKIKGSSFAQALKGDKAASDSVSRASSSSAGGVAAGRKLLL